MSGIKCVKELEARLPARLARWAPQLVAAQLCYAVDAYTLAAIMDRETLGGDACKPKGPGGTGDGGHGRGLMQIDDRYWGSFIEAQGPGGGELWADASFNVLFAASLLHWNVRNAAGELMTAIAAYNCGLSRAKWALKYKARGSTNEAVRIAALDSVTTGGNYLSDVIKRRAKFLAAPTETPNV